MNKQGVKMNGWGIAGLSSVIVFVIVYVVLCYKVNSDLSSPDS